MTILNRLKYAFVVNMIIAGVGVVVAMIFSLDIGETLFSGKVFYPLLAVNFYASPLFEKFFEIQINDQKSRSRLLRRLPRKKI